MEQPPGRRKICTQLYSFEQGASIGLRGQRRGARSPANAAHGCETECRAQWLLRKVKVEERPGLCHRMLPPGEIALPLLSRRARLLQPFHHTFPAQAFRERQWCHPIGRGLVGIRTVLETDINTKVGTIAGCMVKEGKIKRNNRIRLIRDGIVIHTGDLGSLKRFKDDVREVASGFECGLNINNFNDIKIGDLVEAFEEVEVARKL